MYKQCKPALGNALVYEEHDFGDHSLVTKYCSECSREVFARLHYHDNERAWEHAFVYNTPGGPRIIHLVWED